MASTQTDNNCINCQHRHEKSTFPDCVICFKTSQPGNQFPKWEPQETPE